MIIIDDAELPEGMDIGQLNKRIAFAIDFYKRQANDCLAVMNFLLQEVDLLKKDCSDAYSVIEYLADKLSIIDENKTFPLENLMAAQEGQVRPHNIIPYPIPFEGTVSKI